MFHLSPSVKTVRNGVYLNDFAPNTGVHCMHRSHSVLNDGQQWIQRIEHLWAVALTNDVSFAVIELHHFGKVLV